MRPDPFGHPLGWRIIMDAFVVSYALWLLTGSAVVVLAGFFRQAGWA
jgi:hypothetical protein